MAQEKQRLWLNFDSTGVTRPIIWEMSKKFDVIFNIRNSSVTEQVGVIGLELEGEREVIKDAVKWLEGAGVRVEPVEINTIEG